MDIFYHWPNQSSGKLYGFDSLSPGNYSEFSKCINLLARHQPLPLFVSTGFIEIM
jgi:hypothetical protein